jgi:DNA-binding transcriptional ArsR family regulator
VRLCDTAQAGHAARNLTARRLTYNQQHDLLSTSRLNDGRVRMGSFSHLRVVGQTLSTHDEQQALNLVFAALSDPVRREILDRLDGHDLLVSEVAAHFDISLQAISRHIQVLARAGLVAQERTGRISRCRLDAGPIYGAAVWLNRYNKYWQAQFDLLAVSLEEIEWENSSKARKPGRGKPTRSMPARRRKQAVKSRLEKF